MLPVDEGKERIPVTPTTLQPSPLARWTGRLIGVLSVNDSGLASSRTIATLVLFIEQVSDSAAHNAGGC